MWSNFNGGSFCGTFIRKPDIRQAEFAVRPSEGFELRQTKAFTVVELGGSLGS